MRELLKAIYAKFVGDATLHPAINGPYLVSGKIRTDFPYCVLTELSANPDYVFGQIFGAKASVVFKIAHTDAAYLSQLQDYLHTSFDLCDLTLDSGKALAAMRTQDMITPGIEVSKDGDEVYFAISEYQFYTQPG